MSIMPRLREPLEYFMGIIYSLFVISCQGRVKNGPAFYLAEGRCLITCQKVNLLELPRKLFI